MNTTRTGKIARLPRAIRHQLNLRLYNGEKGRDLVTWLNTLPEAQATVATEFAGKPIRPQNLSEWKQGGYRDWVLHQEALVLARHLAEGMTQLPENLPPLASPSPPPEESAGERRLAHPALPSTVALPAEESAAQLPRSILSRATLHGPVTDILALWLAARYALLTRTLGTQAGPEHWRHLREFCADVVELRRGDHSAQRLQIERERLEYRRCPSEPPPPLPEIGPGKNV